MGSGESVSRDRGRERIRRKRRKKRGRREMSSRDLTSDSGSRGGGHGGPPSKKPKTADSGLFHRTKTSKPKERIPELDHVYGRLDNCEDFYLDPKSKEWARIDLVLD